ncbi:hypothetical protein HOG27_00095 [bacterium]|jgi:hypothetical protein|nr:hypothetical protein [bacterium]
MKKITSILLLIFINVPTLLANRELTEFEKQIITFSDNRCQNIEQTDIPTIFIP